MLNDAKSTESADKVPDKEEQHAYVYKPVFAGVTAVTLYNAENGTSAVFGTRYFPEAEIRDNPEAADLADVIFALGDVYNACTSDNADGFVDALTALLQREMFETAHEDDLLELASDADYPAIQNKIVQLIWVYAEKVRQADRVYGELYDLVLEQKSLKGLFFLLNSSSYTAISKSDDAIIRDKDYLGDIDLSTLDVIWHDVDEMMKGIGWNPAWLIFE